MADLRETTQTKLPAPPAPPARGATTPPGSDLLLPPPRRWTALHIAVYKRTLPSIETLLAAGAKFAIKSVPGDESTTSYAIAMAYRASSPSAGGPLARSSATIGSHRPPLRVVMRALLLARRWQGESKGEGRIFPATPTHPEAAAASTVRNVFTCCRLRLLVPLSRTLQSLLDRRLLQGKCDAHAHWIRKLSCVGASGPDRADRQVNRSAAASLCCACVLQMRMSCCHPMSTRSLSHRREQPSLPSAAGWCRHQISTWPKLPCRSCRLRASGGDEKEVFGNSEGPAGDCLG